jgi:hypothetical protein
MKKKDHKVCAHYLNMNKAAHTAITDFFSRKTITDLQYKYITSAVHDIAMDGTTVVTGFHWPFCIKTICRSCNSMLV